LIPGSALACDAGFFSAALTVSGSAVFALIDLDPGFELHEVPTRVLSDIVMIAASKLTK
jgi:hypothetical protein